MNVGKSESTIYPIPARNAPATAQPAPVAITLRTTLPCICDLQQ